MAEAMKCPNCGEVAQKVGNVITCVDCDSVFKITKTGSAKVAQVGWKEEMEGRVKLLEDLGCSVNIGPAAAPETDDSEDDEEPFATE